MSQVHLPLISVKQSTQESNEGSLFQTKLVKKQLEVEAQKIQSRIQLLQQEQLKLSKKNEQTESKLYDMYLSKKQLQLKKEEKIKRLSNIAPPFTHKLAVQQRETMKIIRMQNYQQKFHEAQYIRNSNRESQSQLMLQRYSSLSDLKNRAQQIKNAEVISSQIATLKLNEKRQKIREELQKETNLINQEKMEYDKLIKILEQKEMEVLQSLQNTQNQTKSLQEKFKLAQKLSPDAFESQYGKKLQNSESHTLLRKSRTSSLVQQIKVDVE